MAACQSTSAYLRGQSSNPKAWNHLHTSERPQAMKSPSASVPFLLVLWTLSAACSSNKGSVKNDLGSPNDQRSEAIHQSRPGAEKVNELDLNHDGKPDVWEYTVKAKTADGKEYDRLVRKEMDINWDGKVDVGRQ